MHNEKYVIKIYRAIFMIAALIVGVLTIVNRQMYGEGIGATLTLDNIELAILLIIEIGMIYLSIPVYEKTKAKKIRLVGIAPHRFIISKRIHTFIFTVLVLQIFFTVRTGNGVVGAEHEASGTLLSYVFNILKVSAFMPIYYVAARDTKKPVYWINAALWLIYSLICGWTGQLLTVPFLELFLRAKEEKLTVGVKLLCRLSGLTAVAATLIGGWVYKYAYAFKNTIRYGFQIGSLNYFEALERLISRFTAYPLDVVSIVNHSRIASLYQSQGIAFVDVKAIFRSLVPGSLMNKDFRTTHNIIIQSMYPDVTNATSSNYGLPFYWFNLIESEFLDFLVYAIVLVVLIAVSKKIIYAFDDGSGKVDILYYLLVFDLMTGVSLEGLFAYKYIGLVYFIPIMVGLGVIKLKTDKQSRIKALLRFATGE